VRYEARGVRCCRERAAAERGMGWARSREGAGAWSAKGRRERAEGGSESRTHLPPTLRHQPLRRALPPIRDDAPHPPLPALLALAHESPAHGRVLAQVLARALDERRDVLDAEDAPARLDERVEDAEEVARAGACERRGEG